MDFSKLVDWLASWQNALSLLIAVAVSVWLTYDPDGGTSLSDFFFVFILGKAVARLLIAIVEALWKRMRPSGP